VGLRAYKAKRNFAQTPEPPGETVPKPVGRDHVFVIQKHAASRLHYDFRLEMDGVLKSWAVPKGLPLKKGERRLAVEVEDHPLEYGNFEGTIAPGNYGAGTVMLWDRGTYVTESDPTSSLAKGKLQFTLIGKKLKGDWTLIRLKSTETDAKQNWLILKSGEDLEKKINDDKSILSGRSMAEIAGGKKNPARRKR